MQETKNMSESGTNRIVHRRRQPICQRKIVGFDIDYKRLLKEFQAKGRLIRAFYYTALVDDQEYSSIRPLVDWLDYNGYAVVTKPTKEFVDSTGRRKVKGNMDIELAVAAMEMADHIDHMVLFSGDGDFRSLVEAVQRKGVRVSVVSTVSTQPAMVADELAPPGRRVRRSDDADAAHRARSRRARRADRRCASRGHASYAEFEHAAGRRSRARLTRATGWREMAFDGEPAARLSRFAAAGGISRAPTAREHPGLVERAGGIFGDPRRAAADRRPGARASRRQPHRAAVHRRLRRRSALRDIARTRLRRGRLRPARRTTACASRLARSPTRCAAFRRRTSRRRRRSPPAAPISSSAIDGAAASFEAIFALGRIAHDSVLRALGRRLAAHPFAHGARHDLGRGRAGRLRQLSLLALQHQHRRADARNVPRRADRRQAYLESQN